MKEPEISILGDEVLAVVGEYFSRWRDKPEVKQKDYVRRVQSTNSTSAPYHLCQTTHMDKPPDEILDKELDSQLTYPSNVRNSERSYIIICELKNCNDHAVACSFLGHVKPFLQTLN